MASSKKIISVTMVKNECDIIELFVRYNLQFLDEMYIIDHKCSDSTVDILLELKKEGLPIHIFRYNAYDYNQGKVLTNIQNKIIKENKADFVLFCDADELICAHSKDSFIQSLSSEENNYFLINAYNYFMSAELESENIPLYNKFIYRRTAIFTRKTIANIKFLAGKELYVTEGAHSVIDPSGEEVYPFRILPGGIVSLSHIPYRSKEQTLSKFLLGCLSYNTIHPNFKADGCGSQWYIEFDRIINGGGVQVEATNMPMLNNVNLDTGSYIHSPFIFNGTLKYLDKVKVDALENLVNFSLGYIKFHNDETNRQDLITMLLNLDRNDKNTTIYIVLKSIAEYIEQKSMPPFDPNNLEEI